MNNLFESADAYVQKSDWRDLALIKFCLCAMGVMIGICIPAKKKRVAMGFAAGVFSATYVLLMSKFLPILLGKEEK